ncbi:Cdc6/Cdc18 family protein [Natronorarus salvus]|uniref:Cdc6/Cdc18 family protein n=1 Tax=Natronorarus salvus TaxID=3117733 RepID=UPI002F260053
MGKYDELFDETTPADSVFADKGALDPFREPEEIVARDEQERQLARILGGVHEGYLPTTVSIHGPPGTGKTAITRRLCREFAARNHTVAAEYVNLKECQTLFSAANEILFEIVGEKVEAYKGLDGAFAAIWEALEEYPEWTILLLDEIDQVTQDSNYDPNQFFYRLLRGEGKLERDIQISCWLLSNQLLEVDLRLDSRVQSPMSDEAVFFPPYDHEELAMIVGPRLNQAFHEDAITREARAHGLINAASRWGDVRKTLTLFRHAGETANERDLDQITVECIEENFESTEKENILENILSLPIQHFMVLLAATLWTETVSGDIVQPVSGGKLYESYRIIVDKNSRVSERAVRQIVTDLETMGLVETWIQSRGSEGRAKQIETTFNPEWMLEIKDRYIDDSEFITQNNR